MKSQEKCGVRSVREATELYKARYRSHVLRIPDKRSAKAEWKLLVKEIPCTWDTEEETKTIFTESARTKMVLVPVTDNNFNIFLDGL